MVTVIFDDDWGVSDVISCAAVAASDPAATVAVMVFLGLTMLRQKRSGPPGEAPRTGGDGVV
jgi:hypothetical protein